MFEKNKIKKSY